MNDSGAVSSDFTFPLSLQGESLEVEFKLKLDLSTPEGKSKLAKEICALCNSGGGWIVFGRNDDGTYPTQLPAELASLTQDIINQASSAYLAPPPHCSFAWAKPDGLTYDIPVVRVPPVGTAPVCAKKNGPSDAKNTIVGVRQGIHYVRAAGPVSQPIETPAQWQDVIRRCVLSDKLALLSALSAMMSSPKEVVNQSNQEFDSEMKHLAEVWADRTSGASWGLDLSKTFIQFGFSLTPKTSKKFSITEIRAALENRSGISNGPHYFFETRARRPNRPEVTEVGGVDGLECEILTFESGEFVGMPSVWRVSEHLCGSEIIPFWEDTEHLKASVDNRSSRKWSRGAHFWIQIEMAIIFDFLDAVYAIASKLNPDGKVRIMVSFVGLKSRSLRSPRGAYYSDDYTSAQNSKRIDLEFSTEVLAEDTRSAAVADLLLPINKLFQGPDFDSQSVARAIQNLR